ncbi:type IV pilus modification PilV family protein [Marinobacterium rhizophilum]|uniref:Type II secretion system protein n=1 Tax=Marinobacterium rhizophilum TaxID=420402 RepID=A0ABY5HIH5_9GAMM|nr:type II secretion system protein [Marinobacterium rhizophilum]UTW12181.1 type II secretion system protein [Marinobacterium rhizophilum]
MTSPLQARHPGKEYGRQHGFTLLEVLVAFVILALSLGVILQIFSLTMRTTDSASARQQALLLAESRLAELSALNELRPGPDGGRIDERFDWTSRIERFEFPDQDLALDTLQVPYKIDVTVHWDGNQQLSLTTLRLVVEQ